MPGPWSPVLSACPCHRLLIDQSGMPPITPRASRAVTTSNSPHQTYLLSSLNVHVRHTPCTVGSNSGRLDRPAGSYPWVGVTMSLHKLTAGAGYDYLTRQVAALDATEKGHTGLRRTTPNAVRRRGCGSAPALAGSTA